MKRSEFHFICGLLWLILSYHIVGDWGEIAALLLGLAHFAVSISLHYGCFGFPKETPHEEE